MQDDVYQTMFEVEDRHWWYVAKQQIVLSLLRRYLPPANGTRPRVADLGCGCGAMLTRLSRDYDAIGIDGSPHAIDFCARRGVKAQLVDFTDGLSLSNGQFDAVLMLDVLEHLEDDRAAAMQAASLLRSGGIMICTVPAYRWLWSYWDDLHHHFRRYNRRQLGELLKGAGLKPQLLSYANTALFPLAATIRTLQKNQKPANPKAAMHVPIAPVNWALRTMYASERHLLGRVPLPFGLSVIAVAAKP
jgi:SAM-dependent methyltransferase